MRWKAIQDTHSLPGAELTCPRLLGMDVAEARGASPAWSRVPSRASWAASYALLRSAFWHPCCDTQDAGSVWRRAGLSQVCIRRLYSKVRLLAPGPCRTANSPSFHLLAPSIGGLQSPRKQESLSTCQLLTTPLKDTALRLNPMGIYSFGPFLPLMR